MINRLRPHVFCLIIIILLGLVPLSYFRDGLPIFGGDHGAWPLNPEFQIYRYRFLWNFRGGENYNPIGPLLIPSLAFLQLLHSLGLSPGISEAILLCLLLVGSGLAMYFLATSLFGKERRLLATTAAVIYMLNSERLLRWSIPSYIMFSAYLLYPWALALFINGLKSKKIFRGTFFLVLGLLMVTAGHYMPSYLLIVYFTLLAYFVFYLATSKNRQERTRACKFALLAASLFILLNLYWLVPLASLYKEGISWFTTNVMSLEWTVQNYSKYTSFLHLFQLHGWPGWGSPSFGWDAAYVRNPFLIVFSFAPILLGIVGLFLLRSKKVGLKGKERKVFLFFVAFYLFSLFLSKGTHEPLSGVNWWLYRYIPGFVIFRTGFLKFGIMLGLSLSLLAGFGLEAVNSFFKKLKAATVGKFLVVAFFLLYLVYNFPFFTGEVVLQKEIFHGSSVHHRVPQSYFKAASWINQMPEDFKILSLPSQGNWEVLHWGEEEKYIGVDVLNELIRKPIKHAYFSGEFVKDNVYQMFYRRKTSGVENLLGMQNVKYLLLHNDIDPTVLGSLPADYIRSQLVNQPYVKLEQSFGKLDFYKLDDQYFLPHIYIPRKSTYVIDEDFDLSQAVSFDDYVVSNEIYFANDIRIERKKGEILARADDVFINAQVVDPALHGRESYNEEVHFPYVRLAPDHLLYPYIVWKEKRSEEKTSDLDALIDLKLLYANKRVIEIEKLLNSGRLFYIDETLTRYEEKINEVLPLIAEELKTDKKLPAGLLSKIGANLDKQSHLLSSLIHRLPEEEKERVRKATKEVARVEGLLFKKDAESKEREKQLRYKFNIPRKGEYSVLLDSKDLERYWEIDDGALRLIIEPPSGEEREVFVNKKVTVDGWILIEKESFEEGIHHLIFEKKPKPINLAEDEGPLKVESGDQWSGVALVEIRDLDPNGAYEISFDYKNERGEAPEVVVWQSLKESFDKNDLTIALQEWQGGETFSLAKTRIQSFSNLKKDFNFQNYELTFIPNETGHFAGIAFLAKKPEEEKAITANLYQDIKIERIFDNPVVLRSQSKAEPLNQPQMTFTKINPTKYKASIKGADVPYTLIFSEMFHPFWKAYVVANSEQRTANRIWETWLKEPLSEDNHFLVNGHANAWRIEEPGNYEIILEFWPQRLFYIGLAVAGLTLVVCFGSLIYDKIKVLS